MTCVKKVLAPECENAKLKNYERNTESSEEPHLALTSRDWVCVLAHCAFQISSSANI